MIEKVKDNWKEICISIFVFCLIVFVCYDNIVSDSNRPIYRAIDAIKIVKNYYDDWDDFINQYAMVNYLINDCDTYAEKFWVDKYICDENNPEFQQSKKIISDFFDPLLSCYQDLDYHFSKYQNFNDSLIDCAVEQTKQDCKLLNISSSIIKECQSAILLFNNLVEDNCFMNEKEKCETTINNWKNTINALNFLDTFNSLNNY